MSNDKKLTLNDLAKVTSHKVHWSEGCQKPREDSSLFKIQNEELGGCDRRVEFNVNCYHLLAGAEKVGDTIIHHPSLVAQAIINEFHEHEYGNPIYFRFGATTNCKNFIGSEYRFIVTIACNRLKEEWKKSHRS